LRVAKTCYEMHMTEICTRDSSQVHELLDVGCEKASRNNIRRLELGVKALFSDFHQ